MYKVFINGELLYDTLLVEDSSMKIQSPSLVIDKEGGSFSFTVPRKHFMWKSFHNGSVMKRTSQIIIFENDDWLWEGCILDYNMDYVGNFKIECAGTLQYLKNTYFPLTSIVDIQRSYLEPSVAFAKRALGLFMAEIAKQHNNRINDLYNQGYRVSNFLSHQKIYFDKTILDSIDVGAVFNNFPDHFSRISNFESCYDALQKRIVDDFGGFFYLVRDKRSITREVADQDTSLIVGDTIDGLFLCYSLASHTLSNYVAYLGHNLLDYNISEDFDFATAAIPLGDTYDENHPGDSRWWFKDQRSYFFDISQRANYAWRTLDQTPTGKIYPTGGSRVFLPSTVDGARDYVLKYGMRDVVVEFDTVVAKYPDVPYWNGNGQEYKKGDYVLYTYTDGSGTMHANACFKVEQDHISQPSVTPNSTNTWYVEEASPYRDWRYYYHIKHPEVSEVPVVGNIFWDNKKDYLGYVDDYRIQINQTQTGDNAYRQDYMKALHILSVDYLINQQFNKLVLDISISKISIYDEETFDTKNAIGKRIPVSANLFGENLKPYEVCSISIPLDDDSQSRVTLGGEATKITNLVSTK